MKKNKMQIQQGDVTILRLAEMPQGELKPIKRGKRGLILADGEHTGHAHVIEETDAELYQIGERMLLKLNVAATVVHEEHKPITLQPGIWEIGRVREFDYLQQLERPVQD